MILIRVWFLGLNDECPISGRAMPGPVPVYFIVSEAVCPELVGLDCAAILGLGLVKTIFEVFKEIINEFIQVSRNLE